MHFHNMSYKFKCVVCRALIMWWKYNLYQCTLKICHAQSQRSCWSQSKEGTLWTGLEFIHVQLMLFWRCLHSCFSCIYQICQQKNEFIDLLQFNACSDYISSKEDSLLLGEIREPEWLYIIDHCSSFVARVCNACFSQVFERRTLRFMNILSKRRACWFAICSY